MVQKYQVQIASKEMDFSITSVSRVLMVECEFSKTRMEKWMVLTGVELCSSGDEVLSLNQSWKICSQSSSIAKVGPVSRASVRCWSSVQCTRIKVTMRHGWMQGSMPLQQESGEWRQAGEAREGTLFAQEFNIQSSQDCNGHAYSGPWFVPRYDWQISTFSCHPTLLGDIYIPFQLDNNQFYYNGIKISRNWLVIFTAINLGSPNNQLFRITFWGVFLNSLQFCIPLHEQLPINSTFAFADFGY